MDAPNPYSAPRSALEVPASPEAAPDPATWCLQGPILVARKGVVLPPVCLYSGQRIEGQRIKSALSWTPGWFKVMVVVAPVFAGLAYSYIRRGGTIDYALGTVARRRRRRANLLGLLVFAALLALIGLATGSAAAVLVLGIYLLVLVVTVTSWLSRPFRVVRIDRHHVRLALRPAAVEGLSRSTAA